MSPNATSKKSEPDPRSRRNRNIALICGAVFFGMVGAAFAAIPAYRAFCQVTGYGGTIRKADKAPDAAIDQKITVSFDTNVNGVPFDFAPEQRSQTMKLGETKLAIFKTTNRADHPITVRALYNVNPQSAGRYFHKLQCFCFSDQTIGAGQTVEMPVLYFVDPAYAKDVDTKGLWDLTLSYTFFPAQDAKPGERVTEKDLAAKS